MEALGLIETKGILAAIVSVDNMLKAADIRLVDKTYVGGGLVSIAVTGDVGAVTVAVEAGGAAVNELGSSLLISKHVIPRPQEDLEGKIISTIPLIDKIALKDNSEKVKEKQESKEVKEEKIEDKAIKIEEIKEEKDEIKIEGIKKIDLKKVKRKNDLEDNIKKYGVEIITEALEELRVVELRKLAREYENFGIKGRDISNASKKLLLKEFKKYYEKNNSNDDTK